MLRDLGYRRLGDYENNYDPIPCSKTWLKANFLNMGRWVHQFHIPETCLKLTYIYIYIYVYISMRKDI